LIKFIKSQKIDKDLQLKYIEKYVNAYYGYTLDEIRIINMREVMKNLKLDLEKFKKI